MVWITVQLLFSFIANQSGVKFIASKLGSPDLPPWLRLEQREVTDRAFIYGTPGRDVSSQVVLEVRVVEIAIGIGIGICSCTSTEWLFVH